MPYYPTIDISQRRKKILNEFVNGPKIKFEKILCLNCGSANHKILFTNDRYGLNVKMVLCKKCGFMFLNPRMTQNSADFFYKSDLYRNVYQEREMMETISSAYEEFEKNPKRPFFDIINSLNLKYQSVCEIGSAGGLNLKLFQLAGKDVIIKKIKN